MATNEPFTPALIVVDFQEDFCPPNGSLAVPTGRAILPVVNSLLRLPFALKVATKDWHPPTHISFASNHQPSAPDSPPPAPFTSTTTVTNPRNPGESYAARLWPVHCVQHTPGAALAAGLLRGALDLVIEKGTHPRVETYSAFYDPLRSPRVEDTGLLGRLRAARVTHVFVAGLAADYCVAATARDACREGFVTVVVEEATRPVDDAEWRAKGRAELLSEGVGMVSVDGEEVERVRAWKGTS